MKGCKDEKNIQIFHKILPGQKNTTVEKHKRGALVQTLGDRSKSLNRNAQACLPEHSIRRRRDEKLFG